ncbi:MAG TPA: S41 family peptidase [Aliidiomarina sp.]|nr:S41 family peptidase [Aliidiomarina sp.]
MNIKLLTILTFCFVLNACGGDDPADFPLLGASCSQLGKNTQLFQIMQKNYLWKDDLPSQVNLASYSNIDDLLNDIKSPRDRFSFTMTEQEYKDRYVNAVFFGYGIGTRSFYNEGKMKVSYVYDHSPADEIGLKRADELIEVNGVAVSDWLARIEAGTATNEDMFGPNQEGVSVDIMWRSPDDSISSAKMSKRSVETNTVFHTQREKVGDSDVGYFVFDSFIDRSKDDVNNALDQLVGVDELIIDLRYNGGGLIRIANQIASQTAWHKVEHKTFVTYQYNSNFRSESLLFDLSGGITRLNLDRVYVLTTQSSCSASELIINSLTPFIDVVTIGEETCGKPAGQQPTQICDQVLFAINFQTVNADGFGDYFDGLPVTCPASDTLVADWGSTQDPLLATAYHHLREGSCPAPVMAAKSLRQQQKRAPLTRDPWLDKLANEH